PALHLRPGAGFATRPHGLARHPDRPHPVLRFPAHRPGADLRVFDPVPAVHRAGPGVLQRDPPAGAAGSGWRRVRGRQPGAPARREPRELAEPAEQAAGARGGHPHHPAGAAIQQAGPAAGADPLAGRPRRCAQLPRRAEFQRGRPARHGGVRDAQGYFGAGAEEARSGDGGVTSALNPKYSFDSFVVGAANRLAVTAGRTVSENPGSAYNPLFIYSGSGLGKTHLLMAVGHAAKKVAPTLNIEYLTLDEYVEAFHAAIAAGQGDAFRRRFQNVDVLLVDDVQFLTNRKEMQAELLRLTEALQQSSHQIVLASDRPPAEIADLDGRLISRFSGGLVVDMGIPDYETRVAILRRKAEERGSKFQPGVLETVAKVEYPNVRELMGALNRLIAFQAVNDTPINAEAASKVLGIPTAASPTAASSAAASSAAASPDEFSQFLSDVTVNVGKAVESWRARVTEAVMRWEGEGYRTGRLEKLLEQDTPAAVDEAITAYVQDVERLRALEAEVAVLDPQAAGDKVFHDPDKMEEAEAAATKVRDGAAP